MELEEDRLHRENREFRNALGIAADKLSYADFLNTELQAALAHCVKVFKSQAERGDYPKELLPDCPEYLGKQGFKWALELLAEKKS